MAVVKGNVDFDKWTDESVKSLSYTAKIIHMTLMAYVRNLGSSYAQTVRIRQLATLQPSVTR